MPVVREWVAARGVRSRLKQDIELLGLLPEGSPTIDVLEQHIHRSVSRLVADEHEMRRDPGGIALAVFFAAVTVFFAVRAINMSDWWWLPTSVTGLFTIAGFAVALPKARRTSTGTVIKDEESPPTE